MKTCIIIQTSSNFSQIWPPSMELSALESLKNMPIGLKREKWCLHFSQLFMVWSFWYLRVTRKYISAWMSLIFFCQIWQLARELVALEQVNNNITPFSQLLLIWFFLKIAGNDKMHNILDEFEFKPEWTIDHWLWS